MRWSAVVNPAAGRGRTRSLLPRLQRALEAHDVAVHIALDAADGRRHALDAFAQGRGIVVCGGDGTIAELAGLAADEHAPLAIIPTGAGNDLARHLGIPKRALDAVELLDTGRLGVIDLGRATTADGATATFTTVANTGFDAEANRWANGVRWASGTSLYVLALLRTLARYRPRAVRVRVDDEAWEGPAWLVAVGNTRGYGGGMMITPNAEIDDGLLDVCVIRDGPTAKFLVNAPRVFRGTHLSVDEVLTFRGTTVEISAPHDARGGLELWASGERVGPLPARVASRPSALHMLVPEGSPVREP